MEPDRRSCRVQDRDRFVVLVLQRLTVWTFLVFDLPLLNRGKANAIVLVFPQWLWVACAPFEEVLERAVQIYQALLEKLGRNFSEPWQFGAQRLEIASLLCVTERTPAL